MARRDIVLGGLWAVFGLGGAALIAVVTVPDLPPVIHAALLFGGLGAILPSVGALGAMYFAPEERRHLGHRDTKVSEALAYGASRKWNTGQTALEIVAQGGDGMTALLKELEQAARDDDVRIWAESRRNGPHELLQPDFWRANQIDWFSVLRGECHSEPLNAVEGVPPRYRLMISRAEIERLWPPPKRRLSIRWTNKA